MTTQAPLAGDPGPSVEGTPAGTRPAWPAWYGFAALAMAFLLAVVVSSVVFVVVAATGADVETDDAAFTITATIIQDALLLATALVLAAQVARPRAWHFGLRATPFWRGVKWTVIAFLIYFVFQLVYINVFHPDQEQTTLRDLGAGTSAAMTVVIGILVVGFAPAVEEFFFRGFFYGALRTRLPFVTAALVNGVVFGIVHAPTGLEAVPPLIALGFAFCLAYEATGSILPCIALHTLNNMLAFGIDEDGSWAVGGSVAAAVLVACVVAPLRQRRPQTA